MNALKMRDLVFLIAVALLLGALFGIIIVGNVKPQQPDCIEDEVWAATPYYSDAGYKDRHGVYRDCVHIEELP